MAQTEGVDFHGTACSANCFFSVVFPWLDGMGVWQFGGLDSSAVTMRCSGGV